MLASALCVLVDLTENGSSLRQDFEGISAKVYAVSTLSLKELIVSRETLGGFGQTSVQLYRERPLFELRVYDDSNRHPNCAPAGAVRG